MPTYIMLGSFTEQGIRNVKGSPKRAEAVRLEDEVAAPQGQIALSGIWMTVGPACPKITNRSAETMTSATTMTATSRRSTVRSARFWSRGPKASVSR